MLVSRSDLLAVSRWRSIQSIADFHIPTHTNNMISLERGMLVIPSSVNSHVMSVLLHADILPIDLLLLLLQTSKSLLWESLSILKSRANRQLMSLICSRLLPTQVRFSEEVLFSTDLLAARSTLNLQELRSKTHAFLSGPIVASGESVSPINVLLLIISCYAELHVKSMMRAILWEKFRIGCVQIDYSEDEDKIAVPLSHIKLSIIHFFSSSERTINFFEMYQKRRMNNQRRFKININTLATLIFSYYPHLFAPGATGLSIYINGLLTAILFFYNVAYVSFKTDHVHINQADKQYLFLAKLLFVFTFPYSFFILWNLNRCDSSSIVKFEFPQVIRPLDNVERLSPLIFSQISELMSRLPESDSEIDFDDYEGYTHIIFNRTDGTAISLFSASGTESYRRDQVALDLDTLEAGNP